MLVYTTKNATDLLQVVNLIALVQFFNELQQNCQFQRSLLDLLKQLACSKPMDNKF